VLDSVSLGEKLIGGLLHSLLRDFIIEVKTLNNGVFAILGGAREGEHESLRNTVGLTIGQVSNGLPLVAADNPVAHVVNGGITGGSGR